jgi:hypothetical protein
LTVFLYQENGPKPVRKTVVMGSNVKMGRASYSHLEDEEEVDSLLKT